jgi:hypothetical protein
MPGAGSELAAIHRTQPGYVMNGAAPAALYFRVPDMFQLFAFFDAIAFSAALFFNNLRVFSMRT